MAFNAYLVFAPKAKDIQGESTSHLFEGKGAIEISDYGFAAAMPVTSSRSDGGGATVGRANFEAFTCNKNIDTATPKLVEYCCLGKNIEKIFPPVEAEMSEPSNGESRNDATKRSTAPRPFIPRAPVVSS